MASISDVGSRGHHKFTLTLTEGDYSIANNTSPVSFAFKLVTTGGAWDWAGWGQSISYKITINGESYSGYIPDYDGVSTLTVKSGKQTITHNSNGTKTISYSFSVTDNAGKTYTCGNASESGTMKLSDIPRQATLTYAPNFNDTSDPQIKYSNPAGIAADLEVAIYNSTGSQSYVPYRYVSSTGDSYVFTLTDQERTNLLKAATTNTLKVRFYIKTVLNGKTYLDYLDREMTVKDADPIITPYIRDMSSYTPWLTGTSDTLIKYYSNVQLGMDVEAQKEATIDESLYIIRNGKTTVYAQDGTIPSVESGTFYFSAEDSRGNTTIKEVKMKMVDYVKPTCTIIHNIPDGDGDMTVLCYGDCFVGSFGSVTNSLSVQYRYKEQGGTYGSWTKMTTVTLGDNVYAASTTVSGLEYQKTYVFQTRASDSTGLVAESAEDIVKAKPLFHWGENDFVFEVPVEFKEGASGLEPLTINGKTYDGSAAVDAKIESGSWTPTLGVTPTSYSIRRGSYMKVGTVVTIGFTIKATMPSGKQGTTVSITGVPYNPLASAFGGGIAQGIYIAGNLNFEGWHIGTSGAINARLQPCNNTSAGNLNISSTVGYPTGGGEMTVAGTICYITSA